MEGSGISCLVLLTMLYANVVSAQSTDHFEIRLSDGELGPHEGRLEVLLDSVWGAVTHTGWGINEANVVCRQLGFIASFPAAVGHQFGTDAYPLVLDKVTCSGNETRLDQCTNAGRYTCSGDCPLDNNVGVRCIKEAMPDPLYQIRLSGTGTQFEGLVEVKYNDYWAPVCGSIGFVEAVIVCRQLGFGPPKHIRIFSQIDGASRPKLVFRALCYTWHRSLLDCGVNDDDDVVCTPSYPAAYVACNKPADLYPLYLDSPFNQYGGTVRIYFDGQFGSICDDDWDLTDAEVVCRQLGYGSALYYHRGSFYGHDSQADDPIVLKSMRCTGRETFLAECSHGKFTDTSCSHQEEASVECAQPDLKDFTLRIADGNAYEGRLEVSYLGDWLAICNDTWATKAAEVACRQMGLGPAVSATARFKVQPPFVLWNKVLCQGTEQRLDQCLNSQLGEQETCSDDQVAGVTCSLYANQTKGTNIRLSGGILAHDGAIEVYQNNAWHSVCLSEWDNIDATVACRQLGYRGGAKTTVFHTDATAYITNVTCRDSDLELLQCPHLKVARGGSCSNPTAQAGVTCYPFQAVEAPAGTTTRLRLTGGNNPGEGRVEVYFDGVWGAVCSQTWNMRAANVTCKQLGYEYATATTMEGYASDAQEKVKFLLGGVDCTGKELILSACAHSPWGEVSCLPNQTATVICKEHEVIKEQSVDVVLMVVIILVIILIIVAVSCIVCQLKKRKASRQVREVPNHADVQHGRLAQAEPSHEL